MSVSERVCMCVCALFFLFFFTPRRFTARRNMLSRASARVLKKKAACAPAIARVVCNALVTRLFCRSSVGRAKSVSKTSGSRTTCDRVHALIRDGLELAIVDGSRVTRRPLSRRVWDPTRAWYAARVKTFAHPFRTAVTGRPNRVVIEWSTTVCDFRFLRWVHHSPCRVV